MGTKVNLKELFAEDNSAVAKDHTCCGRTWQASIGGAMEGDLCLFPTWGEQKEMNETSDNVWLSGSTDGQKFHFDVLMGETVSGTLDYVKTSAVKNGRIAWGTLALAGSAPVAVCVFETMTEQSWMDGDVLRCELVKQHIFKMMTPEEVVQYMPKATSRMPCNLM